MSSATDSMVPSLRIRVRVADSPLDLVGLAFTTRGAAIFFFCGGVFEVKLVLFFREVLSLLLLLFIVVVESLLVCLSKVRN